MSVTELGLFHLIVVKLAGFYMKYVGVEIQTIILHPNPKRVIKRDGTRLSQSQAENS